MFLNLNTIYFLLISYNMGCQMAKPEYFQDTRENLEDYLEENMFGIPTEREVSVLEKGLPVYRAVFTRTEMEVQDQ